MRLVLETRTAGCVFTVHADLVRCMAQLHRDAASGLQSSCSAAAVFDICVLRAHP